MTKEKGIPQIRFSGFTDTWEQRKLDECVTFLDTMRKPLKESEREKGIYPYYGASGIVDYVSDYIFDEELVLLSEDGANITDRNYPVCFLASGKYWVNNHAHVLKVNAENENNFICNSLERMDFTQYNSGMAMPKLNKDVCHNIPLFCPVYEEQKQIGDFFRNLDTLITLHQRKYDKLTKVKKAMLEKMFPKNGSLYPEIRFKGFTDAWEQRELGEVVKEVTRNDPTSEAPIMMITANNGFIEQSERYAFNNAGESLKKYVLLEKGELAYNHGASKLRPYGSCFALTTAENARIPFVYHCFSVENQNAEFMSIELNSSEIENQLRKIVSSGARMDGLLNISFDEYSSVSVVLPSIEEQDCIAGFLRHLDRLITLHQRKLEKLKNIKKACLEKMFV